MLAELKKIKYKHASLKLLLGLLTLSVLLSNSSTESVASGSPPPAITNACNDQFYSMMGNNAFMNAEREITASEVIIRKPDSVLEYSCFDQDVAMIAEDIADIFSDSSDYNSSTMNVSGNGVGDDTLSPISSITYSVNMGNTHLDNNINALVLQMITKYDDNFTHKFLGGATSIDYDLNNNVAAVSSTCDSMYQAYFMAKCENFATDIPFDSLENWAGNEFRQLPQACTGGQKNGILATPVAQLDDNTATALDRITYTYFDRMSIAGGSCADPIPTGLKVHIIERSLDVAGNPTVSADYTYDDMICPNPACYYDNTANRCEL